MTLTDQQQELVDAVAESTFVTACPGAGKTRAVVARYVRRTREEPRKGVALVSFTNAAIDEVHRRCADQREATQAPHFVGTFDSFVSRFLVAPLYRTVFGVSPRLIQSWNDVNASRFRLAGNAQVPDVQLSWFDFDVEGHATLCPDRVPTRAGNALIGLLTTTRRQEAENRAGAIYRALIEAGTVSCDAARFLARSWITDPTMRGMIEALVANRFAEVIVDEAQDCGEEELVVLQFLMGCGVPVLMIGDLDQAIYEFRRAMPEMVKTFAGQLPRQLSLSDNFRSTPAICALNASLRAGDQLDIARGPWASSELAIQVIGYRQSTDIASQVRATAEEYGFTAELTITLSHGSADAMRAVGVSTVDAVGNNRVAAIVDAGQKLRANTDGSLRVAALERVERDLVEAAVGTFGPYSLDAVLERHGIDRRWLRDTTVRLCQVLDPEQMTASQFSATVRSRLAELAWPSNLTINTALFRAPTASDWVALKGAGAPSVLPHSTVHGVKGLEFPVVALTLPAKLRKHEATGRTVLDDWEYGFATEARRVLYVGASRAEQLLMLVVPNGQLERVTKLLSRDAVPYQVRPRSTA
ncbi:UvrD-helicase domain-containing protein [Kitasatospora sp. NPDC052896]|uniref:UvrD-helicase domain-containing protein n=1 Tax=Kitasatospora sp. NPDC052896 TaxID=3364061 RepID=UPI0037C910A6